VDYWKIIFTVIDCLFLVDMFLTFFTSISDEAKMMEVTDKKEIAKEYFCFWFWIDFFSIFPFDEFSRLVTGQGGGRTTGTVLVRTLRMGKIGKLIRLMRLLKVFKIMKNSQQVSSQFSKKLEINAGTERLILCFFIFFFMNHIFACMWALIAFETSSTESHKWLGP